MITGQTHRASERVLLRKRETKQAGNGCGSMENMGRLLSTYIFSFKVRSPLFIVVDFSIV
jgi:hypothetical protein